MSNLVYDSQKPLATGEGTLFSTSYSSFNQDFVVKICNRRKGGVHSSGTRNLLNLCIFNFKIASVFLANYVFQIC